MNGRFLGMNGDWTATATEQATSPLFFGCSEKSPINPPYFSTLSILNQHFRRNIVARTTHIHSVNIGDNNANYAHITDSFNHTDYKPAERTQIMRWLSSPEPDSRHQGVRNERFHGSGAGFWKEASFGGGGEAKGGASRAILFYSGNPGVGRPYGI